MHAMFQADTEEFFDCTGCQASALRKTGITRVTIEVRSTLKLKSFRNDEDPQPELDERPVFQALFSVFLSSMCVNPQLEWERVTRKKSRQRHRGYSTGRGLSHTARLCAGYRYYSWSYFLFVDNTPAVSVVQFKTRETRMRVIKYSTNKDSRPL